MIGYQSFSSVLCCIVVFRAALPLCFPLICLVEHLVMMLFACERVNKLYSSALALQFCESGKQLRNGSLLKWKEFQDLISFPLFLLRCLFIASPSTAAGLTISLHVLLCIYQIYKYFPTSTLLYRSSCGHRVVGFLGKINNLFMIALSQLPTEEA